MIGDAIANNPIVHAIGRATGCVDPETDRLNPESPCAKRRDALNQFSESVYDWLFQSKSNGDKNMADEQKKPWQVTITLENAEDLFDVVNQLSTIQGKPGIKVAGAQPRPQAQPSQARIIPPPVARAAA